MAVAYDAVVEVGRVEETMSIQLAKDFLVKIATDEAAAKKAEAAQRAALLGFASELGFAISADDLNSALDEVDELDDIALRNVSAGARRRFYDS
jgi:predicted ribosomally synthesized peptide with nif11-like leader